MTKAQIHFSNDLSPLIEVLKQQLFPEGSKPFARRLIAVPHMALKDLILRSFAKDSQMQVAAGMQIVSLDKAYTTLTKKSLPSKMELSLFLQHELLQMIDRVESLKSYFALSAKEERIGPFCDVLATYFLRYKIFGKPDLPDWQEELYSKLPWIFPEEYRGKCISCDTHLFGFSTLPKSAFQFFEKAGATFYLFSPCEIFWGDFFSEKERASFDKLDLFTQAFDDQNFILSNWGKVGRQLQIMAEDTDIPSWEHYRNFENTSALSQIKQSILEGRIEKPISDESIQIASATSHIREVEVLKDQLLTFFEKKRLEPKDVQVFAPDINLYAPFIEAVFEDLDFSIEGIDFKRTDRNLAAFNQLLALPEKRFSKDEVIQLLPLMREGFDPALIKKWVEAANIRWGFSEAQRRDLYLRDLEEGDIHFLSSCGTWLEGFKRLIRGMGRFDENACPVIGITELEEFNRLYITLCDLADDLRPLFDGTKWTIPTWLRYLACLMESYLPIDPSHDFYKELLRLAAASDHLDQELLPFEGIRRVIDRRQAKNQSAPHLQAIRFASLSEGAILPGKFIAFLGMEEEAFPRREENVSLYEGEKTYRPRQIDLDKYLLLQGLMFAQESLYLSFVRDEEGKLGTSLLVQELIGEIEGSEILHHPETAFDPRYFGGDLRSYNKVAFATLKSKTHPKTLEPLIPSFYAPVILESPLGGEIALNHLFKFARHPLRYYLHEEMGIYPNFQTSDKRDYLLDPLTRSQLVRKALDGKEIKDHLPLNLFLPFALDQIQTEVEEWKEATNGLPLKSESVTLSIGPYMLKGTIDTLTEKGWLIRGKDTLEDRIRFFPQLLIARHLKIPVIFVRDGSEPQIEGELETYLDYFNRAREHPSPLIPSLAKAFLDNDPNLLKKGLKLLDDETWVYLCLRDPLPLPEMLLSNWASQLNAVFGGALAQV